MIDAQKLIDAAFDNFGPSLLDDPTAWPQPLPGDVDFVAIQNVCDRTAADNARSALAGALGKIAADLATDIELALVEDGPLADLEGVLAGYVTGLPVALDAIASAPDWTARVAATQAALADATASVKTPVVASAAVHQYIASDPRLSGVGGPLVKPAAPAKPAVPAKPAATIATGATSPLPDLLRAAGFSDADAAAALGLTRPYFSMIAGGKRPWPGLKPECAGQIRHAIDTRLAAMSDVLAALDSL